MKKTCMILVLVLISFFINSTNTLLNARNNNINQAYSYYKKGIEYFKSKDYENAIKYLIPAARTAMKELGYHKNTAFILHDLANAYRLAGLFKKSIQYFTLALRIKYKIFNVYSKTTARSIYFLGVALANAGEYTKAIFYVKQALKIRLKLFGYYSFETAETYNYLSYIYFLLKDFRKCKVFMNKSYEIYLRKYGPYHKYTALVYNNVGAVYSWAGNLSKALYFHQKALKLTAKLYGKDHLQTAFSFHNLGVLLNKLKKFEQAVQYFKKAISIRGNKLRSNHTLIAEDYVGLASSYREQGMYQKSLDSLRTAYGIYLKLYGEEHPKTAEVYSNVGFVFFYLQEYKRAVEVLIKAENIYNKIRAKMLDASEKETFRNGYAKLYSKIISSLFMVKDYEKAFIFAEKAKARGMIEFLNSAKVLNNYKFSSYGKRVYTRLNKLKSQYNVIRARILSEFKKPREKRNRKLIRKLFRINSGLSDNIKVLNFKLLKYEPKLKKLLKPEIMNFNRASNLISGNKAIIQYFLTDEDAFAFIIYKNKLKMIRLEDNERINSLLDLYAKYIKRPKYHNPHKFLVRVRKLKSVSKALYLMLLKNPVKNIPVNTHLIIIPSGKTGFIPFEGLIMENGRPVIEKYNVSYIPSMSVYNYISERPRQSTHKFLAFGGAVYNTKALRPSANRAATEIFKISGNSAHAIGTVLKTRSGWANLPGTLKEVEQLSLIFYGNKKSRHIFTGVNVSEDRVKYMNSNRELSKYNIIHFATHGYLNLNIPEMSSVVLTQPDKKLTEVIKKQFNKRVIDDGFLTMPEIVNLKIKSELVTLSACETGLGKIKSGEGVINLSRSFIFAGTRKVIVTLWEVNDLATSVFMQEFYKYYLKYNDVYKALFFVKRDFSKGKRYSTYKGERRFADPLYWAPFVVYGR